MWIVYLTILKQVSLSKRFIAIALKTNWIFKYLIKGVIISLPSVRTFMNKFYAFNELIHVKGMPLL